jgi:type I restriction enzyme S subunit
VEGNSYKDEGISLIRSQNVLDLQFTTDGLAFIDDEQADGLKNVIVEEKDVLLNITGDSVARVCMVPNFVLPARVNQHVSIIRADTERTLPEYLLYNLISQKEELLMQSEIGATRKAITKGMIEQFELKIPPFEEQRAIASVLSSLDDKIDLLHRKNQTLEKMAETLFRQWFLPAGRHGVENPNPDWEERPLSSIATFLNGLACQKYPPQNDVDKLPVLKIKELRNGISEDCDWCTTEVDEKYIVKNGDVIFSWSASLMVKIWEGQTCILNQHLFKVTSDDFPKWYYHLWSKFHLDQFIAIARAHATTMGHIKRGDLDEAMVLIPSDNEITEMTIHFKPKSAPSPPCAIRCCRS